MFKVSFNYHNLAHTVARMYDMRTNDAPTKIILSTTMTLPRVI